MFTEFLKMAVEASIAMIIINAYAYYVSRRGLALKILLLTSPVIAASFLLGIMFIEFGFTWITAVIFFVVSLAVGLTFIWAVFKWLISPLQNIADVANRVALGNLNIEHQLILKSSDEMGDMVQAVKNVISFLQNVDNAAKEIAQGNLNLNIEPRSENDTLGHNLKQMIAQLRALIGEVQAEADRVAEASIHLSDVANQTEHATLEVSTIIQDVTQGIQEQSSSLNLTAASVEQMATAVNSIASGAHQQLSAVTQSADLTTQITTAIAQITKNTQEGVQSAAEAARIAHNGATTVEETVQGMERIKMTVGVSAQKVQEMGQQSAQIGDIIETIDDIAAQTNLLALNAAIEAARAGEHGKGFAVVADEVRKLAEKSTLATKEIANLIEGIQHIVADAVAAMDEGTIEIETGVTRANESHRALADILAAAESVKQKVEDIASAAQQIGASSDDLSQAMGVMRGVVDENTAATEEITSQTNDVLETIVGIATVSENNNQAVQNVNAATEETLSQVEQVNASARELKEMAHALQSLVTRFKLEDQTSATVSHPSAQSTTVPDTDDGHHPVAITDVVEA